MSATTVDSSAFTYRDGVSAALVAVYTPVLAIAIALIVRHGIHRKSGWLFLVIFALARIIGSAFELATIHDRANITYQTGYAILQSVGLSPLLLVSLGLMSRNIESINKTHKTFIQPLHLRLVQTILLVGLILGIVGGNDSISDFEKTGNYVPSTLSKAGMALFIVCYVFIVICALITFSSISYAEPGEKRLLIAVIAALPFLLVRLIYSAISIFGNVKFFSSLYGDVTALLIMVYIMELIAALIYEAAGLTTPRVAAQQSHQQATYNGVPLSSQDGNHPASSPSNIKQMRAPQQDSGLMRFAKRTIIGRIIMSFSGSRDDDMEMQRQEHGSRMQQRMRR